MLKTLLKMFLGISINFHLLYSPLLLCSNLQTLKGDSTSTSLFVNALLEYFNTLNVLLECIDNSK